MTTKSDLVAENEELKARIEELETSGEESEVVAKYERRGASLPDQIASWLEFSTGREHDGDNILILDVRADRVQYRLKGTDSVYGILRKSNGVDLVDPPAHVHKFNVLTHGGQPICNCGKSSSES